MATVTDSETGIVTTYYYDLLNRQSGYREKGTGLDHSVTYEYDADNNLASMTETLNGATTTYTYTYDDDNRIVSETVDGITVEYSYDGFGRLESRVVKRGNTVIHSSTPTYCAGAEAGSTTGQISSYNGYTYTYDDNGNILTVSDGTNTTRYEYDSANQLVREDNELLDVTYTWEYDASGNIKTYKEFAYSTGSLDQQHDLISYEYNDESWGDLLTSYMGKTITYDEVGNPLSDGRWTYSWQHGRQLASMSDGTTTWTYTYDANGMRTSRSDGTTTYSYVYNGGLLSQVKSDGPNQFVLNITYDSAGRPLTVENGNEMCYYVTNLQGDVIGIKNTEEELVTTYTYDAWGNVYINGSSQIGDVNPLLYRGYVYDYETGMYYLQSRYYNPRWGRFINADTFAATGQGLLGNNMFAYCNNNPILKVDKTGHFGLFALCALGGFLHGLVEYGEQVIGNYRKGKTGSDAWTDVNIGKIVSETFSGVVSAIPGGGPVAAVFDVIGSAVIEQSVNCIVENEEWNWKSFGSDIFLNAISEATSRILKPDNVPKYIRDIKKEAREMGIKGTKKLTKYLNNKQIYVIIDDAFSFLTVS